MPYMVKPIALVESFVENYANERMAYLAVFDEIYRMLNEAKP
jgi:hypothetical protein